MSSLVGFVSARLATGVAGVGIPLLLARWMSVPDFANYIVILTATAIGSVLGSLGIDKVLYRYLPLADHHNDAPLATRLLVISILARVTITPAFTMAVLCSGMFPVPADQALGLTLLGAAFSVALGPSDIFSAASNSLLRFELQAKVYLGGLVVRMIVLLVLGWTTGALSLSVVFWVLLAGELLQSLVLSTRAVMPAIAAMRRRAAASSVPTASPVDWRGMRETAVSTYVSYLVYLPWQGSMLRLMAGMNAAPLEFATYGFVQTLTDRLRQYLPLPLMQTAVEPMLVRQVAAGYRPEEVARQLDFLRRVSTYPLLLGAACAYVSGDQLIGWVTAGKYTEAGVLVALCLLGLASAMLTSVVWIACLVAGEMPAMMRATAVNSCALLPMLWGASHFAGPRGVAIVSICVGPALWWTLRVLGCEAARGVWRWKMDANVVACIGIAVLAGSLPPFVNGLLPMHGVALAAVVLAAGLLLVTGQLGTREEVAALRRMLQPHAEPATSAGPASRQLIDMPNAAQTKCPVQ